MRILLSVEVPQLLGCEVAIACHYEVPRILPADGFYMVHGRQRLNPNDVQEPMKLGLRLPWKASTPSRKSSELRSRL